MENGEAKNVDLSSHNVLTMCDVQSAVAAGATHVRMGELADAAVAAASAPALRPTAAALTAALRAPAATSRTASDPTRFFARRL